MKKSIITILAVLIVTSVIFTGCSKKAEEKPTLKVGMVTDAGTIDDKSFNQGTWEGILKAGKDFPVTTKYLKPGGTTEADYIKEIGNLYDAGFKFIVTPGFKFETAIFQAQDKYKDAKFVLIDGAPHNADWSVFNTAENTVSIFYAEHESGFLAAVAASLQFKDGEMGYIGGMEIPPVQKFNWGFQQGIKYANENLGTNITIKAENIIYQGTFNDVAAGQQLAAQMFDKGLKAIFCAAGGVGVGAINEAKSRAKTGQDVWIIGVDVDQYADGIYEGEKSIILTSATKKIGVSAYDMIKSELDTAFPGGKTLIFDAANNGIGIPAKNPNLEPAVESKVKDIFNMIKSGDIKVSAEQGNLVK
jgi:basic membrane protein A and related proteins